MTGTETAGTPAMKTAMLIRRPVPEVFAAFINPDITTRFWFTKSSGSLEAGKQVTWEWEMYGISVPVTVLEIEPDRRIVINWPGKYGPQTVEWKFSPHGGDGTFVSISSTGFGGSTPELVEQIADSTGGFSLVLAGLKALLEHGIELNLVRDRHPDGVAG
jgi:uncharacterized protein YndB with AHSA1/START domain